MLDTWVHIGPTVMAGFLASLVEAVEALTIVLAVGAMRGWRDAMAGCIAALAALTAVVAALGRALEQIPLSFIQLGIGALMVLFGLRWLRKAILRSSGVIPLHDETEAFQKQQRSLGLKPNSKGWDRIAFATCFQIVVLEGSEVVFIVLGLGAGHKGLLQAASLGALAATLAVIVIGAIVHRPLSRIPENQLKFAVGVMLSAFGTFWYGEGAGLQWPGGDWSLVFLTLGYLAVALGAVCLCLAARQRVSLQFEEGHPK